MAIDESEQNRLRNSEGDTIRFLKDPLSVLLLRKMNRNINEEKKWEEMIKKNTKEALDSWKKSHALQIAELRKQACVEKGGKTLRNFRKQFRDGGPEAVIPVNVLLEAQRQIRHDLELLNPRPEGEIGEVRHGLLVAIKDIGVRYQHGGNWMPPELVMVDAYFEEGLFRAYPGRVRILGGNNVLGKLEFTEHRDLVVVWPRGQKQKLT